MIPDEILISNILLKYNNFIECKHYMNDCNFYNCMSFRNEIFNQYKIFIPCMDGKLCFNWLEYLKLGIIFKNKFSGNIINEKI